MSQLSTCSAARSQEGLWDHTELAAGSIYISLLMMGVAAPAWKKKKKKGWKILINGLYSKPTHVTVCDSPNVIPSETLGLTPALAAGNQALIQTNETLANISLLGGTGG